MDIFQYIKTLEENSNGLPVPGANLPNIAADGSSGACGASIFPSLQACGISFGYDLPISNNTPSPLIVGLLQIGDVYLRDVAASITFYDDDDDERAISVIYFISNLLSYVHDGTGIGDRWTCALATWLRRYGDCEDGSILTHSLLLAAGVNPNRIFTAFGNVVAETGYDGHAWVCYRRLSDEEVIPLDWTLDPTSWEGTVDGIRRLVDLGSLYSSISHVLTHALFSSVPTSFLQNLETARSSGAASLPALAATGTVGLSAWAALTLPAATATGTCGARASASLPALAATGTAKEAATARGEAVIPALDATGATGATGEMRLSALNAVGSCGMSASGKANFPALTMDAFAWVENTTWGDVDFPALTATGRAVQGRVAAGAGALPAMRSTGRATQGPIARGAAIFPRLRATGVASPLLTAVGDVDLPPLIGRGHAVNAAAWTAILSYDATRLA